RPLSETSRPAGAGMRRAALVVVALVAPVAANAAAAPDYARVAAGRSQAILADCQGCHTAPGGKPFAGGRVIQTPFGNLAAPNITPDDETGIGRWAEEEFIRAVKTGMAPGKRRLYPAMPYPYYVRLSDADAGNLWAYFQTVEPVRNRVRANLLPFPFNIRGLMAGWNALFFRPPAQSSFSKVTSDFIRPAGWARGEYLVNGPGHCGACHTPKNLLGADKTRAAMGGSPLEEGWFGPDISNDPRTGLGGWRESEVAAYLRTGGNSHAMASGPMAEVVENST